jgi:class 3 adenylate cyclase
MASTTHRRSRFTLGVKLSIFVAILVLLVSASMAYFLVIRSANSSRAEAETKFKSLATIIASMRGQGYGGRHYDPMLVKMFVDLGAKFGTHLCFATFQDASGKIEGGSLNLDLLEEAAPGLMASLAGQDNQGRLERTAEWKWTNESVRTFKVKLEGNQGQALGWARLGFSTVDMERKLKDSLSVNLLVTLLAILCGLGGSLLLARHFSRPIRQIAAAMEGVSEGKLDNTLTISSRDEIGVLANSFNFMVRGLRERERIRNTFARYVSDQVAERILKEEDDLGLTGELKRVTVLFLDIRGFTALSEMLRPREVVALLNDYFGIVIDVIFQYEGTINKFIGDSIMAIYGAPQVIDFPEMRGVITAVEIQKKVGEFNWRRMQEGKPVANFGIGVHSGEAIAGNIGSARRMEYTVIGRDVNLAQRIEATTREGQILISETTYNKVKEWVEVQTKEPVFMKGILEPIPLYEVTTVNIGSLQDLRAAASAATRSMS